MTARGRWLIGAAALGIAASGTAVAITSSSSPSRMPYVYAPPTVPPYVGPIYPKDQQPRESVFTPTSFTLPNGWKVTKPAASVRTTVTRPSMIRLINGRRSNHFKFLACDLVELREFTGVTRLVYLVVARGLAINEPIAPPFSSGPPPTYKYTLELSFGLYDPNTAGGFEFQSGSG